jgi:hypothetical protein
MPSADASPYRLLVEGEDDQHVISNLLHEHDVDNWRLDYQERTNVGPNKIAISYKKGVDPLLDDLEAELLRPGQECLGIVLDIDSPSDDVPGGLESRWDSVLDRIRRTGAVLDELEGPEVEGTNFSVRQPERDLKLGIWLMPDNRSGGELEDFLIEMIPDDDEMLQQARHCLEGVPEEYGYRVTDETKALVHTWLAWQTDPGKPMGGGVTAEFFDTNTDLAQRFVAWVRRLFPAQAAGEE